MDDKVIVFRLKNPFPLLPAALGKVASSMCPMMPERLAKTDSVHEHHGDGGQRAVPLSWPNERVPGARTVYARFEGYVPRPSGTPDWTAGPKIALRGPGGADTVIPDASTAFAALKSGQMDWWQEPALDLVPADAQGAGDPGRWTLDPTGAPAMLRFNHLHPPFDNPADPPRAARRGQPGGVHGIRCRSGARAVEIRHRVSSPSISPAGQRCRHVRLQERSPTWSKVKADLAKAGL